MNSACIYYRIFFDLARGNFKFPEKFFFAMKNRQAADHLPRRLPDTVFCCSEMQKSAAAAVIATRAAAVHIAAGTLIAAADPDQDDNDDDPPPIVFAEDTIRRTHTLFPPIKDFTSYYGGDTRLVTPLPVYFCQHTVFI